MVGYSNLLLLFLSLLVLWNLLQIVTELPAGTNWNFDVHWYPKIPGVISASSFDGKIGIYNIEVSSFGFCTRKGFRALKTLVARATSRNVITRELN